MSEGVNEKMNEVNIMQMKAKDEYHYCLNHDNYSGSPPSLPHTHTCAYTQLLNNSRKKDTCSTS